MAQQMRTIRMKASSAEEKIKTKTGKSVDELLELGGKDLTETAVVALIDLGGELDELQKEFASSVKRIKKTLLEAAKHKGWKQREGEGYKCPVSPSTSTDLGAKDLALLLKKMGKQHLTWSLLKPALGEAKKYLGEKSIEEIATVTTEEFGSISFKKKK